MFICKFFIASSCNFVFFYSSFSVPLHLFIFSNAFTLGCYLVTLAWSSHFSFQLLIVCFNKYFLFTTSSSVPLHLHSSSSSTPHQNKLIYEPRHDKTNKVTVRQRRLRSARASAQSDQDQDSLLVKRRNDNHSPGPVIRELVPSSHQRSELSNTILCIFSG